MGLRLQDVTGSVANEADPGVQCPFCLDPQEAGEEWVRWPGGCNHAFHVACLHGWLVRMGDAATCPSCRRPLGPPAGRGD
eukprot:4282376-Alexandrium_andersonii.AAC.1